MSVHCQADDERFSFEAFTRHPFFTEVNRWIVERVIGPGEVDDLVLIAAVWVDWAAADADEVYGNNRAATLGALRAGSRHEPTLDDVVAGGATPWNPFFRAG